MTVAARWRQLRHPREFRIPAVDPGPAPAPEPAPAPDAAPDPQPDPVPDLADDAVAAVATDLWRARRRVDGPSAADRPARAVRMAGRHLSDAADRLGRAGVTVHDHDGQPYVLGLELTVLAEEESPAVTRPTITQTVRPTVRRDGRVIQRAEVVVGVPTTTSTGTHEEREHTDA